ncbi:MAG: FKBP-type peptidyl-prolyl cis-trans isomerase [Tannerellaceae bacterium]|jgi:FKBP-type peptidyl-prolyl cis-trans isomerase FkpA/FKBP-type peptidyl-prolyl cis-trans isomerase FklB|nr:FKBP-type peptidyl-prolyl cis-trans isomerase [Tannerellaceae bacterium]
MKRINVLVAAVITAVGVSASSCDSIKSAKLHSDVDSASYAIGLVNGFSFKQNLSTFPGDPINLDVLIAGLATGLKEDTASQKMTAEEAQAYIQEYFQKAQTQETEKTKLEGEKFLEENKTKSGVIVTESGLQYQVITEGTGPKPQETDQVKVHYTGSLLDGTVFDSSTQRGEPVTFGVNQVIKGWTEGLQIMPVGSKYIFWIPSELGYGENGAGRDIKPNSLLKFEVELLEIVEQ